MDMERVPHRTLAERKSRLFGPSRGRRRAPRSDAQKPIVSPHESAQVPREIVAEDEDGHPYGAIDIEMSSCPLLVECSRIVHAAVAKVYKDWREPPTDFQYVARDLRDRGHHIAMGRAPRAVKILPASLLRTIARDDRPQ